jgi:ABC-2 type transport system permease protein
VLRNLKYGYPDLLMKTIFYIVQKEFLQISRDKFLRGAIIMVPILQMVILVYAATFEMKNIRIHFVDQDKSTASAELMQKFTSSPFFIPVALTDNVESGMENLKRDKAGIVCIIPDKFDKDLSSSATPSVQLLVNSINSSLAELSMAYCNAVIRSYSNEIVSRVSMVQPEVSTIEIETRHWYNPELNYKIYMAPGILALLVTIIGWMMAGLNLVKEKEAGTIEQLNVTPIRKYQFIAGKLLPFMIIGIFDLAFGLSIAWLLFRIPIEGSLFTLFVFAIIYLIAVLGIGLFISTISNTQQQVLFVSFFFVMIFVLMSGLFTAVENMPDWGQKLDMINPLAYFIRVIRMVLLKGSGFADISRELISISILAVCTNALAIWRYRKTV